MKISFSFNTNIIGKKKKNRDGSFTLPLLTDRARYAIVGDMKNDSKFAITTEMKISFSSDTI